MNWLTVFSIVQWKNLYLIRRSVSIKYILSNICEYHIETSSQLWRTQPK